MPEYAILISPGHNRVYYKESLKLALGELMIAADRMRAHPKNIQIEYIADLPYCTFETAAPLKPGDITVLSRLSFLFALFEAVQTKAQRLLAPVQADARPYIDEKITSILKYKGKTNEQFTKLLVGAAWLAGGRREDARLLDPMAGKGTTLLTGMTRGMDVFGIEKRKAFAHDGKAFLKKYLQDERIKHQTDTRTVNDKRGKAIGRGTRFTYANTKEAFKAGQTKTYEMIEGDAQHADVYYANTFFDMIAADLPYGVQHASKQGAGIARSPEDLLKGCLPAWHDVLKNGGAMVLAYNTKTLSKNKMADLLGHFGFTILHDDIDFSHYVDVSILRDIVVAVK